MTKPWRDHETLIRVEPALPCGLAECGQPAQLATIEPDPQYPGLWHLLPICDRCRSLLKQENDQPDDSQESLLLTEKRSH